MKWKLVYTKEANKDSRKLAVAGLKSKAEEHLRILEANPFQTSPRFKKLAGDLAGAYSRRINIKHRLVYQILEEHHTVKVISMWSHYE